MMLRKLAILAALVASFTFAVPAYAQVEITCDDTPPYAVWYVDGSGGGSRLVQCSGDTFTSLSGTFNDKISSVVVVGPLGSLVPCAYSNAFYAGQWAKFTAGQHGFTPLQWPYQVWTSNGSPMDNQISSIKWCSP